MRDKILGDQNRQHRYKHEIYESSVQMAMILMKDTVAILNETTLLPTFLTTDQ